MTVQAAVMLVEAAKKYSMGLWIEYSEFHLERSWNEKPVTEGPEQQQQ